MILWSSWDHDTGSANLHQLIKLFPNFIPVSPTYCSSCTCASLHCSLYPSQQVLRTSSSRARHPGALRPTPLPSACVTSVQAIITEPSIVYCLARESYTIITHACPIIDPASLELHNLDLDILLSPKKTEDIRTSGHQSTRTPEHQNTSTSEHQNTRILGNQHIETS